MVSFSIRAPAVTAERVLAAVGLRTESKSRHVIGWGVVYGKGQGFAHTYLGGDLVGRENGCELTVGAARTGLNGAPVLVLGRIEVGP